MRTFWDLLDENRQTEQEPEQIRASDIGEEIVETKDDKAAKAAKIAEVIFARVTSGIKDTQRDRVAWVLNYYPETRNSDVALLIKYWELFEDDIYNGNYIYPDDLYRLTKLTTIARLRAKIQYTYKLFQASPEVQKMRGKLSYEEYEKAVKDKPTYPAYAIYIDDSGKGSKNVIVGGVWFLSDPTPIELELGEVRKKYNFKSEFHFSSMSRKDLEVYKAALDVFWNHLNLVSLKYITASSRRIGNPREFFTDMYNHLLMMGIEHEHSRGRAPLPRMIQIFIDSMEPSLDNLMIASLKEKVIQAGKQRFDGKLTLDYLTTVSSEKSPYMQLTDLFVAGLNRVINHPSQVISHKDQFLQRSF